VPAKTLVVLNPRSRGGRRRRRWASLERRLRQGLGPLEVERTRGSRDAVRIAREAVRAGVKRIVVAGGDGTVSEVVTGLLSAGLGSAAQIGLLPFGTGGDLVRGLGLPLDAEGAADALAAARPRTLDAGRIRCRDSHGRESTSWFANEVSVGASGRVVALADAYARRLGRFGAFGGSAAFFLAILRTVVGLRSAPATLRVDGKCVHEGPLVLAVVANGGYFGGGIPVAPGARPDDGLLDAVIIRGCSRLRLVGKLHKFYRGAHIDDPIVRVCRGRSIELDAAPGSVAVEADGEPLGALPARVDVLPGALTLLVPPA